MTYREPADVPSGLIDPSALAAQVEQLETEAARAKEVAERRREAMRQKERAKADRRASRVSIQRDHEGALLSLSHQSTAKAVLVASSLALVPLLAITLWALLSWDPEFKIVTLLVSIPVAALPIMGLWSATRNRRPLHLYAARNGFFTLYRRTPDRPLAVGRLSQLEFDVRNEGEGLKKMMPKYAHNRLLGEVYCDNLTPSDMAAINQFARSTGIEVS